MSCGKWGVLPSKGWSCVAIEDLEEPSETCEMCEVATIRYVHLMTHPDYDGELRCGCICAGKMEGDEDRAAARETEFKSREVRRRNWTRRQWRTSASGNSFINVNGFNIVVFPRDDHWAGRIEDRATGEVLFSKRKYLHENAAKLAAFDAMEMLMKRGG